jgi:hypothetical protein
MWIRNTLHLEEVECSQAYWSTAQAHGGLEILCPPRPLRFDDRGDLIDLEQFGARREL